MTKEQIGFAVSLVALIVTLIGVIFSAGQRIGVLTTTVENQAHQVEALSKKVDALTADFSGSRLEIMRLLASHLDATPPARERTR